LCSGRDPDDRCIVTGSRQAGDVGRPSAAAPKVGLFGLIGSGNSGNDASAETVLSYLREAHPDAVVDTMTGGPERARAAYGIEATPMFWFQKFEHRTSGASATLLKALGKGIDTFRIASWVRRHDAVIVPGAGPLENTLPQRAWGFPYALFVLAASGRLLGTKVALVSVGADIIKRPSTRRLSNATVRLASYRSYRDVFSRDAMRKRGIDTSSDRVYPDLVFGIPTPPYEPGDPKLIGVGVMDYHGRDDDRKDAAEIHTRYVETMTGFSRWLLDNGYRVRLLGGDSKFDIKVAEKIHADLRRERPDLEPSQLTVAVAASYAELIREMSPLGMIVATRYHNVMCALKLCKPTISLGYSQKFISLMTDMGLGEFHQFASSVDMDRLIQQFKEMESRRSELQRQMAERNAIHVQSLADQFTVLSEQLLPNSKPVQAGAPDGLARSGLS
jgi:polysaccharide pyruvyl transferase WcaK-like protein